MSSIDATTAPAIVDTCDSTCIVQLRERGTDRCYALPSDKVRCLLGTDRCCTVRLSDPAVLPIHAQLTRERRGWLIRALGPGLYCEGAQADAFSLGPGVEIGVGHTTLIAEDPAWIALRAFCARILGWGNDRTVVVDNALHAIRMSLTHRAPLLLRSDDDAVPIALALHQHILGGQRPFVVCDPRRGERPGTARAPTSCATGLVAVQVAAGGSICVRAKRLPPDFVKVVSVFREPRASVHLIVCLNTDDEVPSLSMPIAVPSLTTRVEDVSRIIDEYAHDAIAALGAPDGSFSSRDHHWILQHAATTLSNIEKATMRRVALNACSNMSRAAARLGMAPVSLSRWIGRRNAASRRGRS
jgi:hypothetical protein